MYAFIAIIIILALVVYATTDGGRGKYGGGF